MYSVVILYKDGMKVRRVSTTSESSGGKSAQSFSFHVPVVYVVIAVNCSWLDSLDGHTLLEQFRNAWGLASTERAVKFVDMSFAAPEQNSAGSSSTCKKTMLMRNEQQYFIYMKKQLAM